MADENTSPDVQGLISNENGGSDVDENSAADINPDTNNSSDENTGADNVQADKAEQNNAQNINEFVGIPENGYTTESIQLPDGMTLNQEVLSDFDGFAKKVNMSQKAYEQSISYGVKLVEETRKNMLDAYQLQQEQRITNYQRESFADKEIGGDKYDEALASAIVGYKYYIKNVDPELDNYMKESGLEYNKSFIKLFRYIGSQMQNDTLKGSGSNPQQKQNDAEALAERMFPTMRKPV